MEHFVQIEHHTVFYNKGQKQDIEYRHNMRFINESEIFFKKKGKTSYTIWTGGTHGVIRGHSLKDI